MRSALVTATVTFAAWTALALMAFAARKPAADGFDPDGILGALCGAGDAGLTTLVAMWGLMSVAMMLPTAWPLLRTHASLPRPAAGGHTGWVAAGYLLLWLLFAAAAALLQQGLATLALVDEDGATRYAAVDALLLTVAGLYQFSALREACVRRCRTPLAFLMQHWREGRAGALALGARHGVDCLGCCGALMLLAFVGGVMNLAWMVAATLLMTLEKLPVGARLSAPVGWTLIAAGAFVAGRAVVG